MAKTNGTPPSATTPEVTAGSGRGIGGKTVKPKKNRDQSEQYVFIEKKMATFAGIGVQPFSIISAENYTLIIGKAPEAAKSFVTLAEYTKNKGDYFTPKNIIPQLV
jgi:hypothetical protein